MDRLREVPLGLGLGPAGAGALSGLVLPAGVTEADAVRLFGAAYRMLGSALGAREVLRDAVRAGSGIGPAAKTATEGAGAAEGAAGETDGTEAEAGGGDASGDPYRRLVREAFGLLLLGRTDPVRTRRDGQHTAAWLPEPVLTAGGALGPMDTVERREAVSMARLVLLERTVPAERAAFVLHEVFGYGSAEAAAVLGVPEAQYRTRERRVRHRLQEAEGAVRAADGQPQRWSAVAELLNAIREEDTAALEELLADDVVAWSDGGWQPDVVRRPVLGAVKVGRFLAAVRGRIPAGARGRVAEVNGDAALVAVAGDAVVGVLAPEFGPQGIVGIRAVADPARLVFVSRQWAGHAGQVDPGGPGGPGGLGGPAGPAG